MKGCAAKRQICAQPNYGGKSSVCSGDYAGGAREVFRSAARMRWFHRDDENAITRRHCPLQGDIVMMSLFGAARLTLSFSKATISFLLCLSLTMLVVSAQAPDGSLRGRAVDVNRAELSGATITVGNPTTGFERVITADANGYFSLAGSRNGRLSFHPADFVSLLRRASRTGSRNVDLVDKRHRATSSDSGAGTIIQYSFSQEGVYGASRVD
jgi:hypothetical protein